MADSLAPPPALEVELAAGFGSHPAKLPLDWSRAPSYPAPARPPAPPSQPAIAPPWSSPYRLGAWLPRRFDLRVPNASATFEGRWPPEDAPATREDGEPAVEWRPEPEPAGEPVGISGSIPPAAERPYERPEWFDTDEDVLGWAPDQELVQPPAPVPETIQTVQPTPPPTTAQPAPASPVPPLLPPGVRPGAAAGPRDATGEPLWDAPQRRPGFVAAEVAAPRDRRRPWTIAAAIVLIPVVGAGMMLGTRLLGGAARPTGLSAVFTAPIMVLRAAAAGRVDSVAVANGQPVEPNTVLLTIHAEPPPDPAVIVLRNRLAAATDRAAVLDATLGAPAATTDAGRAKQADTKRLRVAAGAEIDQLQAALASIATPGATDTAIKAGLHGKVWSIEATSGTSTAAGAPLVRLIDCDHPFLTLANIGPLQAGQAVEVRMPGLPPTSGTVRPASGIAEPTGSLVIEPAKIAGPNGCPIGLAATVVPISGARS